LSLVQIAWSCFYERTEDGQSAWDLLWRCGTTSVYRLEKRKKERHTNTHNDRITEARTRACRYCRVRTRKRCEHETETGREVGNSPTASCHHSRSLQTSKRANSDPWMNNYPRELSGVVVWWNEELCLFVTSYVEGEYYFCCKRTFVFVCLLLISKIVIDHLNTNAPRSVHRGRERHHDNAVAKSH
jgi:hypothetical protein